jgi:hypothetical protein
MLVSLHSWGRHACTLSAVQEMLRALCINLPVHRSVYTPNLGACTREIVVPAIPARDATRLFSLVLSLKRLGCVHSAESNAISVKPKDRALHVLSCTRSVPNHFLQMLVATAASVAAFAPSSSLFTPSSSSLRQHRAALPASAASAHQFSMFAAPEHDRHPDSKAYQQYNTVTFRDVPHPNPDAEAGQRLHVHFGAGRLGLGECVTCCVHG